MSTAERQEERWTAEEVGVDGATRPRNAHFQVRSRGSWVATISVPDTDEGRSTVAKMVAALQMEAALKRVDECQVCGEDFGRCGPCDKAIDAALEAAKRLQP